MYATLFARALNGKIKVWYIDGYLGDYIIIRSGYFNNQLTTYRSKITMKSVDAQILSTIRKKKMQGYKNLDEICILANTTEPSVVTESWLQQVMPKSNLDYNYNLKPMKCQKFVPNKMHYPAFVQPKLNGVRAVLRWESNEVGVGLFAGTKERAVIRSKEGLEYYFPRITEPLEKDFFIDSETRLQLAYDGELYLHNTPLNIINSACPMINSNGVIAKTSNPRTYDLMNFVIFDVAVEDLSQKIRIDLIEEVDLSYEGIQTVTTSEVTTDEDVASFTVDYIARGYEGAVVRDMDAEYGFGSRPRNIMKSKQFQDGEFEVIDIIPKPKEPDTALFILKNDINDNVFECNPMGVYAIRKRYLDNKSEYIGKMATVKFYERSGVKQVPFHANMVTIRDYE